MGEATYYLKAEGCTKEKYEEVKSFLKECYKAYNYWQDNRGKKPKDFWPKMVIEFPQVANFLTYRGLLDKKRNSDCNNALAGEISFGSEEDEENIKLYPEINQLQYHAEVWHWAKWQPLCKFLEAKYQLVNVRYISDEDLLPRNPFDEI